MAGTFRSDPHFESEKDHAHGRGGSKGVEDQIQGRVVVSADIGIGEQENRGKLDHFVYRPEPDASEGRVDIDCRGAAKLREIYVQDVPQEPCGHRKPVEMDQLVELQESEFAILGQRQDNIVVEHTVADPYASAGHVNQSPDGKSPQDLRRKRSGLSGESDQAGEAHKGQDVPDEFIIADQQKVAEEDHDIDDGEEQNGPFSGSQSRYLRCCHLRFAQTSVIGADMTN